MEIDLLSSGELRFCRCDKKTNDELLELLSAIIDDPEEIKELKSFFDGADDIDPILGEEPLCG